MKIGVGMSWPKTVRAGVVIQGPQPVLTLLSIPIPASPQLTPTPLYIKTNAEWSGGVVQTAAGRIYFEMPSNPKWKRWAGYVCSGTVATDDTSGRSIIITAAHYVYDDANKAFARNVLFIPN